MMGWRHRQTMEEGGRWSARAGGGEAVESQEDDAPCGRRSDTMIVRLQQNQSKNKTRVGGWGWGKGWEERTPCKSDSARKVTVNQGNLLLVQGRSLGGHRAWCTVFYKLWFLFKYWQKKDKFGASGTLDAQQCHTFNKCHYPKDSLLVLTFVGWGLNHTHSILVMKREQVICKKTRHILTFNVKKIRSTTNKEGLMRLKTQETAIWTDSLQNGG